LPSANHEGSHLQLPLIQNILHHTHPNNLREIAIWKFVTRGSLLLPVEAREVHLYLFEAPFPKNENTKKYTTTAIQHTATTVNNA